jgi:hypothetical protein
MSLKLIIGIDNLDNLLGESVDGGTARKSAVSDSNGRRHGSKTGASEKYVAVGLVHIGF